MSVDTITFLDTKFEAVVRNEIGKTTGLIAQADVAGVTRLIIPEKSISSLSGIEYFTALTELDCSSNQLTELDTSKNIALAKLYCDWNDLATLNVSNNPDLTILTCSSNQLTRLDVSKNTALSILDCSGNQLTQLNVSKNTALVSLNCGINQLTTLDVSNNVVLENLSCNNNYMADETAIIGLDENRLTVGFNFDPQGTPAPNLETASKWARIEIDSAFNRGFVPDYIQGNYTRVITRQEFCCMAVMFIEFALEKDIDTILSEQDRTCDSNAFLDTSNPYILAAFVLGITNGTRAPTETQPGIFTPDGQFSRQEAATMLMRVCGVIGMKTNSPPISDFVDMNDAASWAHEGINFVYAKGIMNGTSATTPTFNPKGTFTRQESIVTLNRMV